MRFVQDVFALQFAANVLMRGYVSPRFDSIRVFKHFVVRRTYGAYNLLLRPDVKGPLTRLRLSNCDLAVRILGRGKGPARLLHLTKGEIENVARSVCKKAITVDVI